MDIINYQSITIQTLMANLEQYKYNPSLIQRVILDYLDEVTSGQVDIVDPTNPFVFLLESSAVNTALAINENIINLRKQYPSLSQTMDEIYLHMSDKDFLNRFAVPSDTEFTFVIQVNDMYNRMVYDTVEKCGKLTIPRDTEFTVDGIVFTLQYPIQIKRFDNGVVQVSYDNTITSPLQTLSTNIIDYYVRRDKDQVDWLFFKFPVNQFVIQTTYFPVQLSSVFSHNVIYRDQFYFCRVFQRNTATLNEWVELLVTHTDQVFDPFTPTALLKVYEGILTVTIPKIYFTSGLVSGDVRVDVYSTKGELTVNLSNFKLAAFATKLRAINETRDIDDYTTALTLASYYAYSDQFVSGGTNGIDFDTLRKRVIFNSIGIRQLPITNTQIEADVNNHGFDLVKNVDVITNRIFLATQKLPKPINTRLTTSANIGIGTLVTNVGFLSTIDKVSIQPLRQVILSNNLFKNVNGVLSLLNQSEREALLLLPRSEFLALVNSSYYLYNPFYYVLDHSTNEFELRAYHLDQPTLSNINFISQNPTLQLVVNTQFYEVVKIESGYRIRLIVKSGSFYKQLEDGLVQAQIAYYPIGENQLTFINGVQAGLDTDGERIWEFDILTNYDINSQHQLAVTNSRMFSDEAMTVLTSLTVELHVFYTTTSLTTTFVADDANDIIGRFLLPDTAAAITHETLQLSLGNSLGNLWSRSRSYASGLTYDRYIEDIPLTYTERVYATDAITQSIFSIDSNTGDLVYDILHEVGDIVLDEHGETIYKHRKGDVVLDQTGKPVTVTSLSSDKEIDLLLVDGKYHFATDAAFINYRSELSSVLSTWITDDLVDIQAKLLEQTKIFFYPKTTIGMVKVFIENNLEDTITSEQSLKVDLYVARSIYDDITIRDQLRLITIQTLDSFISNSIVNITEIENSLRVLFGDTVKAFDIYNLGGDKNYKIVNLASEHNRLSLRKQLVQQQDGSMIIQEDVVVNFYNIERSL